MAAAASLTERLRRRTRRSAHSPLFARADGQGRLSYACCWNAVAAHETWLGGAIAEICRDAAAAPTAVVEEAVVGYVADNCPDLLLSVLACINLTAGRRSAAGAARGARVVPAMINCRWTPSEMEWALRPSSSTVDDDAFGEGRARRVVDATIVLYGLGYKTTAEEAVRRMNQQQNHIAVALPLPNLAGNYCGMPEDHSDKSMLADDNALREGGGDASASNDDALLLFTSGTSSPAGAKGVRLSHRALLVQAHAKTQEPCGYDARTRAVATTVPWFHVGGMSSALAVMLGGGCLVFPSGEGDREDGRRGFQPERVLDTIQHIPHDSTSMAANTLVVVPAMLHALAECAKKKAHNRSSLSYPNVRLILVGGQSIGAGRLYHQTRQLFPNARIVQTYACTEAGSSVTFEDLGWKGDADRSGSGVEEDGQREGLEGATCVGLPPPHIQIGIFDANCNAIKQSAQQTTLPDGKMGVIGTRGPHVMSGYWTRGGDNATALDPNEDWMLTNDLGYVHPHSGKLFFCGRANDAIRTGGESVLAAEVERAVGRHPEVADCAVFALPDERFGEAVCAAVVLENASATSVNEGVVEDGQLKERLRQHCIDCQLAGFKRPRRVFRLAALPRNSSGKVLKHEIIRQCAALSKERSRL